MAAATLHSDRVASVPNAIAFRTPAVGYAGTGWTDCAFAAFGCRPRGTISMTNDGGRTWRVLHATPRPVVSIRFRGSEIWAAYDSGVTLRSSDQGKSWNHARLPPAPSGPCAPGPNLYRANQVVETPGGRRWALCVYDAGAGNQSKAVFLWKNGRWKRIAWTPFSAAPGYGGISTYGYPVGIAMSDDGFGLIWESRGTLYVTRDGGRDWFAEPYVAQPEIDFGKAGAALRHGVGYVVLAGGDAMKRRLLMTADGGITWHLVHRWK